MHHYDSELMLEQLGASGRILWEAAGEQSPELVAHREWISRRRDGPAVR